MIVKWKYHFDPGSGMIMKTPDSETVLKEGFGIIAGVLPGRSSGSEVFIIWDLKGKNFIRVPVCACEMTSTTP